LCGATTTNSLAAFDGNVLNAQGRCGYGPRLPFMVISPWAKENFVDHTITDQSSVVRFIEDNWLEGARIPGSFDSIAGSIQHMFDFGREESRENRLFLDPSTGEPTNRSLQEQ
jgi:phospholipase C